MLFEALLVFYLLEIQVLAIAVFYYVYEPKKQQRKVYDPWGFWKELR